MKKPGGSTTSKKTDHFPYQLTQCLSPCGYGILVAVFNEERYITRYSQGADGALVLDEWKPMDSSGVKTVRLHRQLIEAWPLFLARKTALETMVQSAAAPSGAPLP